MAQKNQSNFKKAMNELLGGEVQNAPVSVKQDKQVKPVKPEAVAEKKIMEPKMINPDAEKASEAIVPEKVVVRDEAVIPADMVISGNISTKSNMKVMGSIVGDIECEGSILLLGSVRGNVKTANLTIQNGSLEGDAAVKENICIEMKSRIVGNVMAQNVYSDACIEGQIQAPGIVALKENALVHGDIIAGEISIVTGARVKGMVTISE